MLNENQIKEALVGVIDPELGRNIVEAGMVREIEINDGHVRIVLALTKADCPLKNHLQEKTQETAVAVPGVKSVQVELTTMNEGERQQVKEGMPDAMQFNRVGRMVAIMSGKGGVGKSSVTALLAAALQRAGYKVGVMDADLTGPSIPRMFGLTGPVKGIPMGILPIETPTGIKVMSTNLMLEQEDTAIIWRGPIMSGTIKQFWKDVIWGKLDYLLIDLPPGTSDLTLTAMQSLPLHGVILVTTPQGLASMVVRKTVHMSQEMKVSILGIVENMSYFTCPETGVEHHIFGPSHTEEVAGLAEAPILGQLPIDPDLTRLADCGEIEAYEHPAYAALAAAFTEVIPPAETNEARCWENEKQDLAK
jgi:Mrp family chromosome partitioning ATPase